MFHGIIFNSGHDLLPWPKKPEPLFSPLGNVPSKPEPKVIQYKDLREPTEDELKNHCHCDQWNAPCRWCSEGYIDTILDNDGLVDNGREYVSAE